MRDYAGLRIAVLFLLACSVAWAGSPTDERADLAETFARRFMDGEHEQNLAMMTDVMKAASGREPSEALRKALVDQQGPVSEIGKAWFEDRVQGYDRMRVPLRFAETTIDFRLVFDSEGLLAGFFIVPHAEPPTPESSGPGRATEIELGEPGKTIPGTLLLPEGSAPFPAVLLVHGSGPHDRDETIGPNKPFRDLAWGLAERGVASLRYDKRSFARPADLVQLGDELTVGEEVVEDARAGLALLRGRNEIDPDRVYLVGHSLGGTLAPRIAAEPPRPAGIVSLAGATLPLPEKIIEQSRYIVDLDGETSPTEQQYLDSIVESMGSVRAALDGKAPAPSGQILGAPFAYYRDLEAHDPAAEAAALGLPILVLQGGRDYQVTGEDFARWEAALSDKPFACLRSYDELDHLFRAGDGPSGPMDYERSAPVDERVIEEIARWIRERNCAPNQTR